MSEMVERVARAILMAIPNDTPIWEHSNKAQREEWNARARAAIEAMREPTEAMLKAAHIKMQGEAIKPGSYWSGMAQRWRQMIDEALK